MRYSSLPDNSDYFQAYTLFNAYFESLPSDPLEIEPEAGLLGHTVAGVCDTHLCPFCSLCCLLLENPERPF